MIRQTVLPFKLERTNDHITARSGLALYAEFPHALRVETLGDQALPAPRSGRGLQPSHYVTLLSLTLYGGSETLEGVRELRDDHTLRTALDLQTLPSSSAIGDWLKRMGHHRGIEGMAQVNASITRTVLTSDDRTAYTLLVDPTIIEAEKREAEMTYLEVKGCRTVALSSASQGCCGTCRSGLGGPRQGGVRLPDGSSPMWGGLRARGDTRQREQQMKYLNDSQ